MKAFTLDRRQKEYLGHQYNLHPEELEVLLCDLFGFLSETPENFIVRRHRELQAKSWPNSKIFTRIRGELEEGLFRSNKLSERQIRRIIYG